ncbi:MAG TPA: sensor domain-containing diguanylate cyclase, partial [Holophaga sp.]|nr:sensor domain-containing diguanylate cyclase [Holophaga sp.]
GEIGRRLTASLDLDATLESLYGAINALMDAPTLLLALVDEEKARLDYRLVMIQGRRKEPFSCALGEETFGCWCVQHGRDILIGDIEAEYRRYVSDYSELIFDGVAEQSLVFVPLSAGGRTLGVLSVQSHLRSAYDKRNVETVRAIGAYIAIAIENARLFGQVQHLATVDGLTGVLNRRRLTEAIEDAHVKARRYARSAGVIMVDLDHFKRINDTHGHEAGDTVLRAVSRAFSTGLRGVDSVGRFGGEEFVILLPETGLDGAASLAERLRRSVEALDIQLPGRTAIQVTASFGVSVLTSGDPAYEAVLRRADKALYRAKQAGRNRVEVEPPPC